METDHVFAQLHRNLHALETGWGLLPHSEME
jgi:hypothetical protein